MANSKKISEKKKNETMKGEEKVYKCASVYLEQKGYRVLTEDKQKYFCNIVAYDYDSCLLRFVKVVGFVCDGNFLDFPSTNYRKQRAKIEREACCWLCNNTEYSNNSVLFDELAIRILKDDKGFVRFHSNVLGEEEYSKK